MMYSPLTYYSEERAPTRSPTAPGQDRLCRYVISPATRVPPLAAPKCKVPPIEACTEVYRLRAPNRAEGPRVAVKLYVSDRRRRWPQRQQQPAVVASAAEAVAVAAVPPVPTRRRPAVHRRPAEPVPQRSTTPPSVIITAQGPAVAPRNGHQLAVISSDRTP